MFNSPRTFSNLFNRIPSRGYLLTAIIIFASSSSMNEILMEFGAEKTNVLFFSNLFALILLFFISRKKLNFACLKRISRLDWLALVAVAILGGVFAPYLMFKALDVTVANNVTLISRIEPPMVLLLSVIFLKERVNLWIIIGASISFLGVILTILLQHGDNLQSSFQIGSGELMTLGAAIAYALSTIISKLKLKNIPLNIFTIFRISIGTLIFFLVTRLSANSVDLSQGLSPFILLLILFYSLFIVVIGQFAWFQGLKKARGTDISLASSFTPVAGVLINYFLLNEIPTIAQFIGCIVIVIGIILNHIGIKKMLLPGNNLS